MAIHNLPELSADSYQTCVDMYTPHHHQLSPTTTTPTPGFPLHELASWMEAAGCSSWEVGVWS